MSAPTGPGPTVRVGVVGCGGIARSHGRAYAANPRVELVAAHDVSPESAKRFATEWDLFRADQLTEQPEKRAKGILFCFRILRGLIR